MHPWQATPIRDTIVRCLQENGAMTIGDIAKQVKMPVLTIRRSIEAARVAHGTSLFRISAWKIEPRHQVPVFDVTDEPGLVDEPKPASLTGAERQRRYKDKHAGRIRGVRRAKAGLSADPWSGLKRR